MINIDGKTLLREYLLKIGQISTVERFQGLGIPL
jgi:hypothetical protein